MIIISAKEKCCGCYACVNVCPRACLKMQKDDEGFWYPKVKIEYCINCNLCDSVCPILNSKEKKAEKSFAYAAYTKDEKIRMQSSSGGIFVELAKHVINKGGVVFGVAFTEDFQVKHGYTERIEGIESFLGSKYVQSEVGEAYKEAERFLKQGKLVLFTGTPCQISGLQSYLGKNYENLITQDIICHGVPSPMVWQKYIEYRQALANGAKPRKIAFRSKNTGWKQYSVSFSFKNNTEYREVLTKDPMMKAFLKNLSLRPSCYDCAFKTKERNSDLTLADFWGIWDLNPQMYDNKGTSLVVIHSVKGAEIFREISDRLVYCPTDLERAISYNSAMTNSVQRNSSREDFIKMVAEKDFGAAAKKYCREPFKAKIKKWLVNVKRKLFGRRKSQ